MARQAVQQGPSEGYGVDITSDRSTQGIFQTMHFFSTSISTFLLPSRFRLHGSARLSAVAVALAATAALAHAQPVKLPLDSDDKGTVYVTPNVTPTEKSIDATGGTVGVQRPDGSGVYGGVDTATPRPTYSVGASTPGNVSYSAGVQSDGKTNNGVKAGVTIKY